MQPVFQWGEITYHNTEQSCFLHIHTYDNSFNSNPPAPKQPGHYLRLDRVYVDQWDNDMLSCFTIFLTCANTQRRD